MNCKDLKICKTCKGTPNVSYLNDIILYNNQNLCIDCGNVICDKCKIPLTKCKICGFNICQKCPIYIRYDWFSIKPQCGKCKNFICYKCVKVCHECYNKGEKNFKTLCVQCNKQRLIFTYCSSHGHWVFCNKHTNDKPMCPECSY